MKINKKYKKLIKNKVKYITKPKFNQYILDELDKFIFTEDSFYVDEEYLNDNYNHYIYVFNLNKDITISFANFKLKRKSFFRSDSLFKHNIIRYRSINDITITFKKWDWSEYVYSPIIQRKLNQLIDLRKQKVQEYVNTFI